MQNFSLSYRVNYDQFFPDDLSESLYYDFEGEGIFEGKSLKNAEDEECLSYVKELRSIIKRDMQNIIELRIKGLNNNASLIQELYTVIDTIDNDVQYDVDSSVNFFFLTNHYLCFNNFENFVDELTWGTLGDEAATLETIVIIDVNLKSFYFIRVKKRMATCVQSTTINAYSIKDNNVKKSKIHIKGGLTLEEYNDNGIRKILSRL